MEDIPDKKKNRVILGHYKVYGIISIFGSLDKETFEDINARSIRRRGDTQIQVNIHRGKLRKTQYEAT